MKLQKSLCKLHFILTMNFLLILLMLLSLVLYHVKGQTTPCEGDALMIPIRPGSKYLMPKSPVGLTTNPPPNDLLTISEISDFCHDPLVKLEMVSVRHYQDWKSIQEFMRNDANQWVNHGSTAPEPATSTSPILDDSYIATGMRYRYSNPVTPDPVYHHQNRYTAELLDEEAFFIWDTDDKGSNGGGVETPQPNEVENKEQSVDIMFRQAFNQEDTRTRQLYISARDTDENTVKKSYRFICQFQVANSAKPIPFLKDLRFWTSRAMFRISNRPVSFPEAKKLCKTKNPQGFKYEMWNGVTNYKIVNGKASDFPPGPFTPTNDPATEPFITDESEALGLGDSILEALLEEDVYPFTSFFSGGKTGDEMKRKILKRPLDDTNDPVGKGNFAMIDPTEVILHKNSDAYVLCTYPMNEICLPNE